MAAADQTQDPSKSYERSHPGREAGQGKLEGEADKATPQESADKSKDAPNRQEDLRQVNAHDTVNQRGGPAAAPAKPSP